MKRSVKICLLAGLSACLLFSNADAGEEQGTISPSSTEGQGTISPSSSTEEQGTISPNSASEESLWDKQPTEFSNYVFIGDSRTVGMGEVISSAEDTYCAKIGMGYTWMVNTGVPMVEDSITEGTAVIILMGVNDLDNVANYASYVSQKAEEWAEKGATTYYVSVTPVSAGADVTNEAIANFNAYIMDNIGSAIYLDLYNKVVEHGFSASDGVHYSDDTYVYIYNTIKDLISES